MVVTVFKVSSAHILVFDRKKKWRYSEQADDVYFNQLEETRTLQSGKVSFFFSSYHYRCY